MGEERGSLRNLRKEGADRFEARKVQLIHSGKARKDVEVEESTADVDNLRDMSKKTRRAVREGRGGQLDFLPGLPSTLLLHIRMI